MILPAGGVDGSSIIWDDSVEWGDHISSGFTIIWDDFVGSSSNNCAADIHVCGIETRLDALPELHSLD